MSDDDAGFFRNLSGLATEYVREKRRSLAAGDPETNVDSTGGGHRYNFGGQEIGWDDLREIKDIRESGGQVAQLMDYKALLNFGEGAEIHVEDNEETAEVVDGDELTLEEWLETEAFPKLDLTVLDLGGDALWYPCAVGEIQETVTGDFKRALPAEPWTIIPITNDKGEVEAYRQRTKAPGGGYTEQTLPAEDLWHIVVNKSSARDQTGISEVLRNKDEIRAFKENEAAINQAIELHGFPQRHVKVGREEGAPVSDNDLRRVRTIFDPRTTDANTAYFTGQDVDVETLEAHNFDYSAIHEMDMRNLTTALGLPLEAGNVGADGLGSGKPAELRFALLKLAIKANQRSFGVQFVERVMRPVIRDYSPFDHTATITLDIADPLEDIGEVADLINSIGDYMTNEEIRSKLDMPAPEDDEIAEGYRSPADIEAPEDEGPFGGGGGLFRDAADGRTLQQVPDNAVSISDRSEAPDDAQIITGPGGGLYYVPGGDSDDAASDTDEVTVDPDEIAEFEQTAVEEGDDVIIEGPDGEEHQVTVEVVGSDDAFVVEDSQGEREVIEPNGESRDGRFEAVGMVGDTDGADTDTDGRTSSVSDVPEPRERIDAPLSEGGLRPVPEDTSGEALAESIPTIDTRFSEELEDLPVDPDLNLSEEDVAATREAMAQQFDNFRSEALLGDYFERMSHIHGKSDDTNNVTGSANEGMALGNEGNMMSHFQVTNPSKGDKIVFHEQMHTIHQALGYSSSGESAGAGGGFQDYDSPTNDNPDSKTIEDAFMSHENDDAPPLPEGTDVESLMNEVDVDDRGTPETPDLDEIGETLQQEVDGPSEEQFRNLVAEVNRSFAKTQGVRDREGDAAARRMVKRDYQMSNTNEFMAVMNETMQKGEGMHVKTLARNHPEAVNAYINVFDVPDETKDELEFFVEDEL